jgi:hypothetical protein
VPMPRARMRPHAHRDCRLGVFPVDAVRRPRVARFQIMAKTPVRKNPYVDAS